MACTPLCVGPQRILHPPQLGSGTLSRQGKLRDNPGMHDSAAYAEALLDDMSSRLDVWKPGAYAGGLFAAFARAQRAVAEVNAADRPFHSERLQRLADRAGIVLAPAANRDKPIATIKADATLFEVETALSEVQPPVVVREEAPGAFTVWCDRVGSLAPTPPWLVGEINAGLRLFRNLGVLDNYVLTPAPL